MEEHLLDVRDLDTEYFVEVRVWLDRQFDCYYLPRESAERLGETDDHGNFELLDGSVIAEAEEIEIDGKVVEAWRVPVHQFTTRPSCPRES